MVVKVKICGLTRMEDACLAAEYGADLLGFVFFPKSARYVPPERVKAIVDAVKSSHTSIVAVGVFVNETVGTIKQVLEYCALDAAQLHGDEPPELLGLSESRTIVTKENLSGRAYKAVQPRSIDEVDAMLEQYVLPPRLRLNDQIPALLLDAYHPHLRGGTGDTGNWAAAARAARQAPILLAGGLKPENIVQAIRTVRPWGVDVASKIESAPGKKDVNAMQRFIALARDRILLQGEEE
jgi:phosphoribosylanthranilate isomerase